MITLPTNDLPYIVIPEFNYAKMLIDTGATSSFLLPEIAKKLFPAYIRNHSTEVTTPHGHETVQQCVYTPIPKIFKLKSIGHFRFHLFKFHDFLEGLIGMDILQQLRS